MKKRINYFLVSITFLATSGIVAQNADQSKLNDFSVGYHINQYQHDFGMGINITTPVILKSFAVRLQGNMQWLQNQHDGTDYNTWDLYSNARIGIVGKNFVIPGKLSVYGEGGFILIFPNDAFSSKTINPGGYGVFGFEFNHTNFMGQFIELGGVGTGSIAEKSTGKPIYSNGFLISTGIRFYL